MVVMGGGGEDEGKKIENSGVAQVDSEAACRHLCPEGGGCGFTYSSRFFILHLYSIFKYSLGFIRDAASGILVILKQISPRQRHTR